MYKRHRLNGTRRPKSLLALCSAVAAEAPTRFAALIASPARTHIDKGSCSNSRGIARGDLERRVLVGLKGRMVAPEIVEDAMRAHAEETNRPNREPRYAKKIVALTKALNHKEERQGASQDLRALMKILPTPGPERGGGTPTPRRTANDPRMNGAPSHWKCC
ncbi:hypothetical protein [Stappia sp. WLB 29]|uniref:hypothetical protein n=1 Tax=Stappia sp. WLB 29 TaxID=2925220 RepID=UPI0020BF4B18|nr:hypothetical protein [Stappia sp. WLB 29]